MNITNVDPGTIDEARSTWHGRLGGAKDSTIAGLAIISDTAILVR